MFLEAHFGKVELYMPDAPGEQQEQEEREQGEEEREQEPWLTVRLDDVDAQINLLTLVSFANSNVPHFVLQQLANGSHRPLRARMNYSKNV